jgi:hypothetical protein
MSEYDFEFRPQEERSTHSPSCDEFIVVCFSLNQQDKFE